MNNSHLQNTAEVYYYAAITRRKQGKEIKTMDFNKIKEAAQGYQKDMTAFLRAIVKNPGESCDEKAHIDTIAAEMKKLDFDEVVIDPQGNVIGYMGTGDKIIAYDAHIDTVGIGNIDNWNFDPYEGYENDTEIGGRGVSDQCGGLVSAVYGARIMKDLDLIPEGCKIMVVGTVQEEDCDGLCWQYIINEDKIRPEFVVSTEPTDGGIYRGQRGRMEIRIDVKGVSCHGSAPERGDNAIYKMADILQDVRALNENDDADETEIKGLVKMLNPKYNPDWEEARFLGRGTVTVSQIFYTSPSRCAVADSCAVSLDRRMTFGETWESCLDEIRALPSVQEIRRRRSRIHVQLRPSVLHRMRIRDRVLLPDMGDPERPQGNKSARESVHISLRRQENRR